MTARSQARRVGLRIREVVGRKIVRIAVNAVANLQEMSPVDTGWLRSNWLSSFGQPIDNPVGSRDAVNESAAAAATTALLRYKLGQGPIFIVNAVPYTKYHASIDGSTAAIDVRAAISRAIAESQPRRDVRGRYVRT